MLCCGGIKEACAFQLIDELEHLIMLTRPARHDECGLQSINWGRVTWQPPTVAQTCDPAYLPSTQGASRFEKLQTFSLQSPEGANVTAQWL